MEKDLASKLNDAFSDYSSQIAVQFKKNDIWTEVSYGDLGKRVEFLSNLLLKNNIQKGDRVAVLLENRPEWPVIFFATVTIGAISVPINPEASQKEIENILIDSQCKIVFVNDSSFLLEKENHSRLSFIKRIISVDSEPLFSTLSEGPGVAGRISINPEDTACILYTSGTTDEPKGVMLSHGNLLSNCVSLERLNIVSRKDSIVSILPLHHAYPLTITMILPLLYGGKIIYPGSLKGEVILDAMAKTNPSVFVAVPQIFYTFHEKIKEKLKKIPFPFNILIGFLSNLFYNIRIKTKINLSRFLFSGLHKKFGKSLRLFITGGARLDDAVEKNFFKFGFTIYEGYGLTETSPVLTINSFKKFKPGSVGLTIPDVELRLENKDEKGIGEVIARGPNIMKGYYKRKDLTADVIKDGWFYTGDLGYIDKDGYLYLTGRSKDVIVLSSGLNINPEEIEEEYLKEVPAKEMCVFEAPSKTGIKESDVLWGVVRPDLEFFKKYGEVNLRNVIKERFDNVSRRLPQHKRLMGFSITLESFPRTLLGKIKRFAVKDIYTPKIIKEEDAEVPREFSKEDKELMGTDFGKKIINFLKKETKIKRDISPADSLELDLGLDSLGRVELISGLEKIFNAEIEDEAIGNAFTVKDLILGVESFLQEGRESLSEGEREVISGPGYWKRLFQVLPKPETLKKIDLNPGFIAWIGGFLFTLPFYLIFKIFYNLKVEGKENFPDKGPYILYVNHTSYFDGFLLGSSFPRFPRLDLFFVGFRPYFTVPVIRNLVRIGRMIPLDFSSHLIEALRSCYYVLSNKRNLCLFPEGLRTLDGKVGKFKKGFGILVKESDAKLVPVVLEGAYEAWPRTSKFPKRHPIKVKFGKPKEAKEVEEEGLKMGAEDSYDAICIAARKIMLDLKG